MLEDTIYKDYVAALKAKEREKSAFISFDCYVNKLHGTYDILYRFIIF